MINQMLGSYRITDFLRRAPGFELYRGVLADTLDTRVFVKRVPRGGVPVQAFEDTLTGLAGKLVILDSKNVLRHREVLFDHEAAYLVGEAIDGQPLSALVPPSGIHPIPHVLGLIKNTAEAVAAAHAIGLLHGGLTAGQILCSIEKSVRVDEFGLAEALARLGLPREEVDEGYRAPEAEDPGESTVEQEVYGLGALLVHLLTGRPPDPEEVRQGISPGEQLRSRRPDLPQRVFDLVARATAYDPEERFPSVLELRDFATDGTGFGLTGTMLAASRQAWGDLPEMVLIPSGAFQMGNSTRPNESPVQEVDLPAFEIGRFPVTNRQYLRFCEETGKPYPGDPPRWGAYGRDCPDHPAVNVNFAAAVAYCAWLSQITGQSYRLPSEAEWEKAARGGVAGKLYPWGDENPDGNALFGGRTYAWEPRLAGPQTRRVGCFAANGFGLYDLAGNVWEWCGDVYAPYGTPKRRSGIFRVARGGCWSSDADSLRCAFRMSFYHTTADYFIGFRCARACATSVPT